MYKDGVKSNPVGGINKPLEEKLERILQQKSMVKYLEANKVMNLTQLRY